MSKLHPLDLCDARDLDGTPYRHELTVEMVDHCAELCVECGGFAAYPHPRAHTTPRLYRGVEVLERCRGLALCPSDGCRVRHLVRHDRALREQEIRDEKAARERGRSAA